MNLSNEKNTLLNSVSRRAVALSAQPLLRVVTRGAMLGVALTAFANFSMGSNSALAACTDGTGGDSVAGANNDTVTCGVGAGATADGYDTDGYDGVDIVVVADGVAIGTTGDGIDIDGSDGTVVVILNTEFSGTNAGQVQGFWGDGIDIDGNNNEVFNGGGTSIGGGSITSVNGNGISIDGFGNEITNVNNGNGGATTPGLIAGGGGSGDDGIIVEGGTVGSPNVINNGSTGSGTAYIISGGTTGAVTGDDGIDASGYLTVNNSDKGAIIGGDRGIQHHGPTGATLTVDNDGSITGYTDDGIVIQSSDTTLNYTGSGTVTGGSKSVSDGAGIDISPGVNDANVNVTFSETGGIIQGTSHGIEVGETGKDGDNNTIVIKGTGTVQGIGQGSSDGIHVFDSSDGTDITIDEGATIQGKDDGIDLGSNSTLLVDGASTVQGDTDGVGGGDGIQGNDNNNVHVTGASKVIGDPGILMNDNNIITIDGGSDVTGDPEDGINVDDDNTILIGGAGGAGTVYGNGANSDGISLTDAIGGGTGSTNDNSVTIGDGGTVDAQRDGIVVGNVDVDNDDNSVLIQDGGNVIAGRDGIVVNGQDDGADDNTVTINDGGEVNAGGDGVRLLGDSIVTNVFDALAGGGPILIGDADGTGNDLVNEGIIRAGGTGVLVSNTNSDVDNSGGEIYAGEDGVRFTTLHTDEADGDGGGFGESGYQSDADSLIVAGRDGIHYDNYNDDAFSDQSAHVSSTGGDVNGLGYVDAKLLNVIPLFSGDYPEVVENEGTIEAQRHGIRVNDNFDVTNGEDGVIVAGGLPGEGASGGDGIHADANNRIDNFGTIATGLDADGDSHGIEIDGESNTVINAGLIDTRGDTFIDRIDNTTHEAGVDENQDNGAGGDGIHANSDGLTLNGLTKLDYDQQQIRNYGTIIAADDGIDAQSGLGIPGGEQIIYNGEGGEIHADDDGIVAENYNDIWNRNIIHADEDGVGGGDGINVGHSNLVTNDGEITSDGGNGIVMGGQKGPFSFGNEVYNNGEIVAGEDGIQVNGEQNYIENTGDIKGGVNGVALNDEENDFASYSGTIEGGSGAGIYSNEDNDIELSGTTTVTSTAGLGGDGIFLEDDNSLEIDDGVTVNGDNNGIVLDGDDNDVDYEGDGVNGVAELSGTTGDALQINGDSNTFDSSDDLDLQGGDDGIHISGNTNSVDIDGNVGGEDDGIYLDGATGNVITVGGDVTGDTDNNDSGDGIDIAGGGSNNVTVTGAISGDPGVLITNSSNNVVSGATISGTDGGVVIGNGNNNSVSATAGNIEGNTDIDGDGVGVDIGGNSNVVTASGSINGSGGVSIIGGANIVTAAGGTIDGSVGTGTGSGVSISGNGNQVGAATGIVGDDGGVLISGNSNNVDAGDGVIEGNADFGVNDTGTAVSIVGNSNNVIAGGSFTGEDGVVISGNSNSVSTGDGIFGADNDFGGFGSGVTVDGNNNSVTAVNSITGTNDGVNLDGTNNTVTADGIIGEQGDGVEIDGSGNSVDGGSIGGGLDGVNVDGDNNEVDATTISGGESGVAIAGDGNDIDASGAITGNGDEGVDIDGNSNNVAASGVQGNWDGVDINGNTNTLTIGAGGIDGDQGDGVDITGSGNVITSGGTVSGDDDGVVIDGDTNKVSVSGDITGLNGDGVDITGNTNLVTATGAITGDPGVIIAGNSNSVSSASISATNDAVNITGNSNSVDTGAIDSANEDGVDITGNTNTVTATTIEGGLEGVVIAGSGNIVTASSTITGQGDEGVAIDSGSNNTVSGTDISGFNDGVEIQGGGSNNTVNASGTITGQNDDGVVINGGSNNSVTAGGTISGPGTGALILNTSNATVTSGGSINGGNTADNDGVQIVGSTGATVSAVGGIDGHDGVVISGGGENDVTAGGLINGNGGDGVLIISDDNSVTGGSVAGAVNGATIVGDDNELTTTTGGIAGSGGYGLGIAGDNNDVDAETDIGGTTFGVAINGGSNTVSSASITGGSDDGVDIDGNQNTVTTGAISTTGGDGVDLNGDQNSVTADTISSTNGNGIRINGDQNEVDVTTSIDAGLNGVWFDSGTDNNVDVRDVEITAGADGILVDEDGNTFQHNAGTSIIAGDDGIEFEYGGLVNAYESLVWLGTINADDDGIVADSGFFTIINNGTINADVDDNNDGNGISVTDDNTVENNGTITGWNGIVGGDKNDVTNDGTITAENDGIQVEDDNTVINNGTINAGDDGIDVGDNNYVENNGFLSIHADDNGIEAGDDNVIVNNGLIEADADKNSDGAGIFADSKNTITNSAGADIDAFDGIDVADFNTVTNEAGADIDAVNVGIYADYTNTVTNAGNIDAGNVGIQATDYNVIDNSGTIDATNGGGIGVYLVDDWNDLTNSNHIQGQQDGVVALQDYNTITNESGSEIIGITDDGIQLGSSGSAYGNFVSNAGSVKGGQTGIEISGSANYVDNTNSIVGTNEDGVHVLTGSSNTIDNEGLIEGGDDGVDFESGSNDLYNYNSVYGQSDGVEMSGGNQYVYNSGTIEGEFDNGIRSTGDDDLIYNWGSILGNDDGVSFNGEDNTLNNYSTVRGYNDDGVDINGEDNTVYNNGSITGEDEGIEIDGDRNSVQNDNEGSIIGLEGDGIDINSGTNNSIANEGLIQGYWEGIDNYYGNLTVDNYGGSIVGQNRDGIRSNLDGSSYWTSINNYSGYYGEDGYQTGSIVGADDGIEVGGAELDVYNGEGSNITGTKGDGIYTTASYNEIINYGTISGANTGITDGTNYSGEDDTYIFNGATGVIVGSEAGYLYEDGSYYYGNTVQIDNVGRIEATGPGVLPTPEEEAEETAVNLDLINGEDADPVAAIDTSNGGPGLDVFIYNWGLIEGANEFSAAVVDDPETEEDETAPSVQLTNRFAILGGEGNEYIANFAGGTINGDIATQAGDDVLAMEIGSTLNGDADLGQTIETTEVLGFVPDDPATKDVDESKGGTAVGFVSTKDVDVGVDAVILFGEGYQAHAGDITEAEVLYVNDRITEDDLYYGNVSVAVQPVLENQPFPNGTWSLNGNVTIDGVNRWTSGDIDTDGDGVTDDEVGYIDGTLGTVVDNGRLNIGATEPVTFLAPGDRVTQDADGKVIDDTKGDGVEDFEFVDVGGKDVKTSLQYDNVKLDVMSTAVLTSPVVDVLSGGTLGGHGTIVTNPGANGGNGGVNLTGAVQGDKTTYVGVNEDNILEQYTPGEARGALIVGVSTGDLVTQDLDTGEITDATKGDGTPDFKFVPAEDEEDDPTKVDLLYTIDSADKLYPDIALPVGFIEETGPSAFDFTTDSPRYATLAPGDEITRIGTLTVFGNVTMDGRETAMTQFKVAVADDPETEQDESEGGTAFTLQNSREVVTNWGSQFQADLKDSGEGDQLLVKKTGVTTAFTGSTFDIVGPGPVDLVTQDDEGTITDDEAGDGVNDFDVEIDGEDIIKTDIIVAGEGGPDGVPDGVAYTQSTVLDGNASIDGRLDIRLDGEFVDLVDNSQSPLIDDPSGPTGCGDDPDGADSCPQIPNPLYNIPDGIADVDADGIAKHNADFSKDTKVWDVIVAEGGVTGKFETLGFDGGPNDGAVVVRYDDPDTAENEEVRVQLLKAYLQYLPDRVRIISIPDFGPKGTTINQIATGEYIDSLTQYGLNEDLLHCIIASVGLDGDIPAALDALHPEWYNAFNEVGFSIARGAEQQAYIRTIEAQGFSGGQSNRVVMNVGDDSVVGSSASDKRASFWLAGSWGNADVDDGSNEGWLEYKYQTLTGYAGFDYLINPNLLIGILGGFSNSDVDSRNGTKEGDVDSWQVGGYASYFTESWFLNIGGGIGDMNIESIRNIAFGSGTGMQVSQVATADYDGDITYFYGKGGYSFDLGDSGWKLSPELALSYVKVKQDAFSETGVGNFGPILLNVDQQSVESLRGTAQLRLSKTFMSGNGGGWMPYVRAGVANEFEDDLRPITSGFQGAPGTDFTVFGQVPRQTTVIFGAGVTGKVSESFSLYLDYSGELGGSFSEHVISGGARFHF
ncbi:right-handed parallel beta-helix repeat-containing protein [Emcibacter sp. SYSU 3D8]|uniref:right-handed parallel beta-helix repeat-containing protein n=1 Tax=Emcibacter sp. SYSU 3D8 TaxID=3133969 RepID=UPI0031FECEFB